jgi:hypothetical protein
LRDPEDLEGPPTDTYRAAHDAVGGNAVENIVDEVVTDDADIARAIAFLFGPSAARVDPDRFDVEHGKGSAPDGDVRRLQIVMLDQRSIGEREPRPPAFGTETKHRRRVVGRDVLTAIELYEIFARGNDLRALGDGEDGRPLRREGAGDRLFQPLDDGDDRDHGRDADDDPEQGESRA